MNRISIVAALFCSVALFLAGAGILAGCHKVDSGQDVRPIPVTLIELKKENRPQTIVTSGQFSTDDEAVLSFKTGGIIREISVKEGDPVRKGQVLASLDLTEIAAAVSQATAAFEKASRDFQRVGNLYRDSVATLAQLQDARTALDIATQQLTVSKYNLNYSQITAIADGFLLKRFLNPGQLVGPGTPVLQTNGAGRGLWILKAGVSDVEWVSIAVGDSATLEIDAIPGRIFPARVLRKSKGVDPSTGTLSVELQLLSRTPVQLAAGLFGKATITTTKTRSLWAVPYESLSEADGASAYVFVTQDGKTARKIQISIAELNPDTVLVASGLDGFRSLIVSGSAYLNEGSTFDVAQRPDGTP